MLQKQKSYRYNDSMPYEILDREDLEIANLRF